MILHVHVIVTYLPIGNHRRILQIVLNMRQVHAYYSHY